MARDIHTEVTTKIIESLEAMQSGEWTQPWADTFSQKNGSTGRHYNGVNVWLLSYSAFKQGFKSPLWVTFNQAKELAKKHGGKAITKGSKGTLVTFWKIYDRKLKGSDGIPSGETKTSMLLKHFTVFNKDQTGLPETAWAAHTAKPSDSLGTFTELEGTLGALGVSVLTGSKAAYYPSFDHIEMPPKKSFTSTEAYYATLAHEHVHATGSKCRLDRDLRGRFDKMAYAMEELVAELGAAYLCAEYGVTGQGLQHPEYLGHWLKVLKSDNKAIFTAASKAKKAVAFIHETVAQKEKAA